MNWVGNLLVFGSFFIIVALIVGGCFVPHGGWLVLVGCGLAVCWIILAIDLLQSMNSDI